MVKLTKQPGVSFYAADGAAENGVAFLPGADSGDPDIEFEKVAAHLGFFLTWSGGSPKPEDLTRFDAALLEARVNATPASRIALQCFRTGGEEAAEALGATGSDPTISATRLLPSDKERGKIKAAFALAITASRLVAMADRLQFNPIVDGHKHRLISADSDIALDNLMMPIAGPLAGTLGGGGAIEPADLAANHFSVEISARGAKKNDGTGGSYFSMDRDERLPLVGSGQQGTEALAVDISLDLLDVLNARRTHVSLARAGTLHSGFRTTHGHKVLFTPTTSQDDETAARFSYVLRRRAEALSGKPDFKRANLLLEGDFEVTLANENSSAASMPASGFGIVISDSQHEYLQVPGGEAAGPVIMSFRRGAAHIGESTDMMLASADDGLTAEDDRHDLTSWARVTRQGLIQPVISEARDVRRLDPAAALAGPGTGLQHNPFTLSRTPAENQQKPDDFVPVLPRSGPKATHFAAAAAKDKPTVASRLAAERRKLLTVKSTTFAALAAPAKRTTPIGFELEETSAGVTRITLARTLGPDDDGRAELVITNADEDEPIARRFVDDIVRNQLFLVANTTSTHGTGAVDAIKLAGTLTLSKWGFAIDFPPIPVNQDEKDKETKRLPLPLVIIKGFEGLTIEDLFSKQQLWSGFGYLRSPDGAAPVEYARKQFKDAVVQARDAKDPIYEHFLAAIADPKWTGVLVLGAPLAPDVLPDQVRGLLGGIDMDRLKAHHFAVPVRRLTPDADASLSKPFAAVDYRAQGELSHVGDSGEFDGPAQAPNKSDDAFRMKVTELKVGFFNGAIQSFACKLDLKVGSFFHDTGIKITDPDSEPAKDNTIELTGRWSRRVVDGQSLDTYDFFTETVFEIKMSKGFPLLDKAMISRISYVAEASGEDKELVTSKFLVNGDMDFKELPGFDFLDVKTTKFTGLSIDLRFRVGKWGVSWPKFRFSPGALQFDFDTAGLKNKARGFFGSLPLKFTGFGWLGGTFDLPDLGYFALGKGNGGKTPFMLKFDLDLGSLGSFASALSKFKMELGFAFGIDGGNLPNWNLGMRFAGSGGKDLDIGLEGFLQVTCERYEVVELKQGKGEVYYGFRGVNARLVVFDQPLPPEGDNANVFIFLDPAQLGKAKGIGWLLAYTSPASKDIIDLRALVLGQRVQALSALTAGKVTTREVIAALANLGKGVEEDADPTKPYKIPAVTFAPELGWTVGFHAMIYRFIELGFALRDPDLAGLLLDVKVDEKSDKSLFSVDILYRKLTEDLGVYSAEVVLPPELRNWQFGAAGITLPVIGIEVYTDGNWGIDLGYPANKDFSRSFALSIFPFVGAGGIYYRRVSGPAALLLPKKIRHDSTAPEAPKFLAYDPVTEFGMGFRVGLGVVLAQGILNAGLSLTVYGYLEGAFGRLQNPDNLPTKAQRTYISVAGAVGVMGELYGYVDFGIVKAGVFVQLYVEIGFHMETDRAVELYYEVGVSVQVRVVIARIRVFGHGIEIAISFSFRTKVRFSQFIGNDRNPEYYDGGKALAAQFHAIGLRPAPKWTEMPSPADWAGIVGKVPLEVMIQPDITVAPGSKEGSGDPEIHAVFLMSAELPKTKDPSPAERLVQGLTAWALCANLEIAAAALRDTPADAAQLRAISARLAQTGPSMEIAAYSRLREFLAKGFDGTTRDLDDLAAVPEPETDDKKAPNGMILPMPEAIVIHRMLADDKTEVIRLADCSFVTEAYRRELDEAFKRLLIEQRNASAAKPAALADSARSLTSVLFEEWALMIMRSGIEQVLRIAEAGPAISLGQALDRLVAPFADADGRELRSPAAEAGATVSRFFTYGQRIPLPSNPQADQIPAGQEKETHTGSADQRYFHAMLRLAGQQVPIGRALGFQIPAQTYDDWLVVPSPLDFDLRDGDAPDVLAEAKKLKIEGELERGRLFRPRRRYVALGSVATASALKDSPYSLWPYGKEARALAARDLKLTAAPTYYMANTAAGPRSSQFEAMKPEDALHVRQAIVIDVSLRRPDNSKDPTKVVDAFEIKGIAEPFRNLIDPFAPISDDGAIDVPAIEWIRLCKIDADGQSLQVVGAAEGHKLTLIQSNLSVEARPEAGLLAAGARNRIDPVADTDSPLAFVRLLRQAAIVNTGGYHLAYPGASADLADLFAQDETPNVLGAGARLRVIIALGDTDKIQAYPFSNALLVDTAFQAGTVIAVRADDTADPVHEPGVLPVEARRKKAPAGDPTEVATQLAERFSNLALKVEVRDDAGQLLGTQFDDQSFPIGPDMDDAQNEPADAEMSADDGNHHYRASIPVAKIAGIAARNVYDLVGGQVRLRGTWRDIYGNNWPTPFAETEVDLVYSDRLLGLTGLPYIKAAYWPVGARTVRIALTSDYASSLRLDGSTSKPSELLTEEWVRSAHEDIDRNVALLQRAVAQLNDKRVTVSVASTLGDGGAMDKSEIVRHIEETFDNLDHLKTLLAATKTWAQVTGDIKAWLKELGRHEWRRDVPFAPSKTRTFEEMKVAISVRRPDPATHGKLYDKELLGRKDMEAATLAAQVDGIRISTQHIELVDDVSRTVENVAPNISRIAADAAISAKDLPSGDTSDYMAALAATAIDHRIAVGYGDTAGVTEKATWLIARDYLKDVSDGSLLAKSRPIALGLPPLQTAAYSQSFKDLQTPGGSTFAQEIRDADADAYGREALARIERLLSPATTVKLLNSASMEQQAKVRQALGKLLNVKEDLAERLSARLTPVFVADATALDGYHAKRRTRPVEALADLLKRDLRNHYKITSLLLYLDPTIDGIPENTRAAQGVVRIGGASMRATNYSLPLATDTEKTSRDLVIFCEVLPDPVNGGTVDSLSPPLSFDLTHIQKWPRPDVSSGMISYRKAAWLTLYDDTPAGAKSWLSLALPQDGRVPNPLRQLPEMPSLDREFFESDDYSDIPDNPAANLGNARQWRSIRDFRWQGEPQDRLTVEIHYSSRGQVQGLLADDNPTTALVRFVLESDRVLTAIQSGGIDEYVWLAARAQDIFGPQKPLAAPKMLAGSSKTDRITLNEIGLEKGLGVRVTGVELFSSKIAYRAAVEDGFGDAVEFRKDTTAEPIPLPGAKPTGKKLRRLSTHGLDILEAASAGTTLSLTRNETIDGKILQKQFVYRLPTIASGRDVVPSLDLGDTVSAGAFDPTNVESIAAALKTFLAGLLNRDGKESKDGGQPVPGYTADLIFEYEPMPFTGDAASGVVEMGGPIMAIRTGFTPDDKAVESLANEICNWLQNEHPAKTGSGLPIGSVIVDARVFVSDATDETDQRVLRLSRCQMTFKES